MIDKPNMDANLTLQNIVRGGYWIACLIIAAGENTTLNLSPLLFFLLATFIAVTAGNASLLRTNKGYSTHDIINYTLNMGVCGASASMIAYSMIPVPDYPGVEFAVIGGIGIMALGGMPTIDWTIDLVKRIASKLITPKDDDV